MAYPPSDPAANKANATPAVTDHPNHHNELATAIATIVDELGSGPKGGAADLTARLAALASTDISDFNTAAVAAGSGTYVALAQHGTTLGTSSIVAGNLVTDITTHWGISGGVPYYETDPANVVAGEEAIMDVDETGAVSWVLLSDISAKATAVENETSRAEAAEAQLAPKASPTFTGTPTVPDDPYDATTWNGSLGIPTKNAIRDKIESLAGGGSVDDTAYDATSWDGDTTHAPSKNAVRDKIEALDTAKANLASPTFTGTPAAPTAAQGTNTTQVATTAYVQTEVGLLIPKSVVTTADDLIVGTGAGAVTRLGVAASRIIGKKASGGLAALTSAEVAGIFGTPDGTKFLADDGTLKTPSGGGSLTNSSNFVTSDSTMTTAGTYYDGPTLTLAAGTWMLFGAISIACATTAARTLQAKLWDGTTTVTQFVFAVTGTATAGQVTMPLSAVVAPGGSTTYKISATSSVNGETLKGTSFKGSYLYAVKIG